jgi:hypothetical protein
MLAGRVWQDFGPDWRRGLLMGLFKEKKPTDRESFVRDEQPTDDASDPTPQPQQRSQPAARYGIQQAIDLMRSLPKDLQTTDIVVQVIKRTSESTRIDVGSIIADASQKEEQIETRIRALQDEITRHQQEIETRTSELSRLKADLAETTRVKEKLLPHQK